MKKIMMICCALLWIMPISGVRDDFKLLPEKKEVRLTSNQRQFSMFLPRKVINRFIDLIKEHFSPKITLQAYDQLSIDELYFYDFSEKEIQHLEEFLKLIYYASERYLKPDEIRDDLEQLCTEISGDLFYRRILSALKQVYRTYPDQQAITIDHMQELVKRRPESSINKIKISALLFCIMAMQAEYNNTIEALVIAAAVVCTLLVLHNNIQYLQEINYWDDFNNSLKKLRES